MEAQELYRQKRLAEIKQRREQKRKRRIRKRVCALITLVMVSVSAFGAVYTASAKEITITEINEFEGINTSITVKTRVSEVGELLSEQGIAVGSTDKINIAEDTELNDKEEIIVRRGKEIKVVTPSSEETVVVTSADTHEALREAGYAADAMDEIKLDGGSIAASGIVELRDVYSTYETVTEEIPFETVYEDDPSLYIGEEKTAAEGTAGSKTISYKVEMYEDGMEKSRTAISESITAEPVNAVIKKGTKEKPENTAAPVQTAAAETGSTVNGLKYTKKITMSATAYTNSPAENAGYSVTAMGTPLRRGVAAVDPSVIPLGTKLYVVSADGKYVYGTAVAEDTGGAIKGNKIDLCFTSSGEARSFGRRDCIVYVLE